MTAMDTSSSVKRMKRLAPLLLLCLTVALYWPVCQHDFVGYDDSSYIIKNPQVQGGISRESLRWAFTATRDPYWAPLLWLSYMADFQIHGLKAGGFHLTNLILHAVNVLLLFLVLARMTRTVYRAWFVAALFAVHPLHVESVAWIAERKDVLSTCFWLLTVGAYGVYTEKRTPLRYASFLVFFVLGLMAKPMLVTLPCVLLLLDVWPLGRLQESSHPARPLWKTALGLIVEKAPLFLLSAGACAITYLVLRESQVIKSFETIPLRFRLANVAVSYATYLGHAFCPWNLAVLYPYPHAVPAWQWLSTLFLLAILSVWIVRTTRATPFVTVGWLWFVGTLAPVIGVIRVGAQSWADRYAYIPFIGLYIAITWGLSHYLRSWRFKTFVLPAAATAAIVYFSTFTILELRHWKDGVSLFSRAVEVTRDNYIMHNNLGLALMRDGRLDEAEVHFREALRIQPNCAEAQYNLSLVLEKKAAREAAASRYSPLLREEPAPPVDNPKQSDASHPESPP